MTNSLTTLFAPAVPEIFLLVMICVIMLVDLFLPASRRGVTYVLSQLTLIVLAFVTINHATATTVYTFDHQFLVDRLSVVLKCFMYLMVFLLFLYSRRYVAQRQIMRGEFHVLILLSLLGGMVIASAASLLTLYLGLELMSLPIYALVAIRRDAESGGEAAMKYFVMGAIASGFLLYGMSLVYGISGSLQLTQIANAVEQGMQHSALLLFGLMFFIVGIGFKFGLAPFHMWVPDVYQGSPTSITALIGTMPKLAAFALLIRLIVDGLHGLQVDWQVWFYILAIISIFLGNVLAVVQHNIKRMFAYSTIAHVGFIFLGIAIGTIQGLNAALFYTIVYVIMAIGGFGVVLMLSRQGLEVDNISDFAGLNARHVWLAFLMMLLLLSMAGVPPLLGFDAKLLIINALVDQHQYFLAGFALVMSVVGAYYYIRVIKVMYFDQPADQVAIKPAHDGMVVLSINGLAVLVLGFMPSVLMGVCHLF